MNRTQEQIDLASQIDSARWWMRFCAGKSVQYRLAGKKWMADHYNKEAENRCAELQRLRQQNGEGKV